MGIRSAFTSVHDLPDSGGHLFHRAHAVDFGEQAAEQLVGTEEMIIIGGQPPVTFFAYPDKPNWLTPDGARIHQV